MRGVAQSQTSILSLFQTMLPSSLLHFSSKHKNSDSISNYSTYIDTIEDALRALSLLLPGLWI